MAESVPGGIVDIDGFANNSDLESLARFAIDEYNKKQNAHLEFEKLVGAKKQIVEGFMYYLKLEATHGGKKQLYETKIWVKAWEHFKEVQEFKPVIPIGDA